jgi:hypothetical protein
LLDPVTVRRPLPKDGEDRFRDGHEHALYTE